MDDELIEEILCLYRRVRDHNDDADDDTLIEPIMWELRACEILDLASDALPDNATGVDSTRSLAISRIRTLIHAYKNHHPDD